MAHPVGDVGSNGGVAVKPQSLHVPFVFRRGRIGLAVCDTAALCWIRRSPIPSRRMNLCVPILNCPTTMLYDRPNGQRTPLGRIGKPDDVADVVAFLASADARWVTGQVLAVGGGSTP
jgi:NAD(P)-dependent dehydrogenase (short-subunit alcohol dehydrogenase family)